MDGILRRAPDAAPFALVLGAAGLTGAVNGGYVPTEWGWPALAFVLVALLAALLRDGVAVSRRELAVLAALTALLVWTLVSIAWSVSATQPVLSAELLLVYAT